MGEPPCEYTDTCQNHVQCSNAMLPTQAGVQCIVRKVDSMHAINLQYSMQSSRTALKLQQTLMFANCNNKVLRMGPRPACMRSLDRPHKERRHTDQGHRQVALKRMLLILPHACFLVFRKSSVQCYMRRALPQKTITVAQGCSSGRRPAGQ